MIWCYIISLIIFILCIALFRSTKESNSYYYYYDDESAEYWKMSLWMLLLIIIIWIIPYVNLVVSMLAIGVQIVNLAVDDSLKLVPRKNTFFGKVIKILMKEI